MNRPEAPWPVETRTRPFIDPEEIDRIMGRPTHRLHRPCNGDGTWQPQAWELRLTLAIVVVVVFAMFWVAK